MIEIFVIIGAVVLVAFTVVFNLVRRKKGKSSCGCDCPSKNNKGCAGCSKNTDSSEK